MKVYYVDYNVKERTPKTITIGGYEQSLVAITVKDDSGNIFAADLYNDKGFILQSIATGNIRQGATAFLLDPSRNNDFATKQMQVRAAGGYTFDLLVQVDKKMKTECDIVPVASNAVAGGIKADSFGENDNELYTTECKIKDGKLYAQGAIKCAVKKIADFPPVGYVMVAGEAMPYALVDGSDAFWTDDGVWKPKTGRVYSGLWLILDKYCDATTGKDCVDINNLSMRTHMTLVKQ